MRIVLIEDNEILARGVANALRDLGHGVDCLGDGRDGADFLAGEGADVAIIDVSLPGLNGFDVVRLLRKRGHSVPVLMLTARGGVDDRVRGLNAGADDYLVKPFDMAELVARVCALARRAPDVRAVEETVGTLCYNRSARRLSGPEGEIDLARRELALFEHLLDNQGRVISKDTIADTLYGVGSEIEPNAIQLVVSRMRRKLLGSGIEIHTARGIGYMLEIVPSP